MMRVCHVMMRGCVLYLKRILFTVFLVDVSINLCQLAENVEYKAEDVRRI